MNKMYEKFDSTQDCGDREATRLESCKLSLLNINKRIDNINLRHYKLLNKLDVVFNDGSVCKESEDDPSTGLLRDIESIIIDITNKVNVLENDLNELENIV